MKAIYVFILAAAGMFFIGPIIAIELDAPTLSAESILILSFAVTWCIFKDREVEAKVD